MVGRPIKFRSDLVVLSECQFHYTGRVCAFHCPVCGTILSDPDSPDGPFLEKEIDALVYDLYKLTSDEIAIVEESTGRR
jgi:hypothetical protein